MEISDLTYKMVAVSETDLLVPSECVDWAIEMIEMGHESPNLLMLAACDRTSSYFGIEPYLNKTIDELGLLRKTGEEGIISYAYYYINKIAKNVNVRTNLSILYKYCQMRDYEKLVYDFYLLYWAWDQIDYDDTGQNHYWSEVTGKNIEGTVVKYVIEWITKNKMHYTQHHVL